MQVCAGLSSRLQEYKSENAQLEELLIAEVKYNCYVLFCRLDLFDCVIDSIEEGSIKHLKCYINRES